MITRNHTVAQEAVDDCQPGDQCGTDRRRHSYLYRLILPVLFTSVTTDNGPKRPYFLVTVIVVIELARAPLSSSPSTRTSP